MSSDWVAGPWTRWSAIVLGVGLMGLAGCGGGTGDLSGTVTFNGKPVRVGTVAVAASDGSILSGVIQDNGTYSIPNVPSGEAKIAVHSPDPKTVKVAMRKKDEKPPPPDASKWVAIPEKYADHAQSELTTTIKTGPNTFPIDLK